MSVVVIKFDLINIYYAWCNSRFSEQFHLIELIHIQNRASLNNNNFKPFYVKLNGNKSAFRRSLPAPAILTKLILTLSKLPSNTGSYT